MLRADQSSILKRYLKNLIHVAYAALDVTDPEPLPQGHPLWSAPNLIVVPHVGGNSEAFEPRGRALIESQLKLLAAGSPLEHVVAQG